MISFAFFSLTLSLLHGQQLRIQKQFQLLNFYLYVVVVTQ